MIYYTDPETGEPRGIRRAAPPSGAVRAAPRLQAYPQVTFNSA